MPRAILKSPAKPCPNYVSKVSVVLPNSGQLLTPFSSQVHSQSRLYIEKEFSIPIMYQPDVSRFTPFKEDELEPTYVELLRVMNKSVAPMVWY